MTAHCIRHPGNSKYMAGSPFCQTAQAQRGSETGLTSSMRCFLGAAACAGLSSLSEAGTDISLNEAAGEGHAFCSLRFFLWGSTASPAESTKNHCTLAHLLAHGAAAYLLLIQGSIVSHAGMFGHWPAECLSWKQQTQSTDCMDIRGLLPAAFREASAQQSI